MSLTQSAQAAQDRIGWTDIRDQAGMATALLELAGVVVAIARRIEATVPPSHPLIEEEPECCASGSCEVCRR